MCCSKLFSVDRTFNSDWQLEELAIFLAMATTPLLILFYPLFIDVSITEFLQKCVHFQNTPPQSTWRSRKELQYQDKRARSKVYACVMGWGGMSSSFPLRHSGFLRFIRKAPCSCLGTLQFYSVHIAMNCYAISCLPGNAGEQLREYWMLSLHNSCSGKVGPTTLFLLP